MRREKHITLVDRLPVYYQFDECILGNFAYTTPTERYILNEYSVCYQGKIETPGYHFGKICESIQFPKKTTYHDEISYPYYAKPCRVPYAFYLDIRKAYYQIASVYGLECSHREGRYMAFGVTQPPEIMQENKLMRALLVSGTYRKSHMTKWRNHVLKSIHFPNRNYAPHLQRAIIATLHSILSLVGERAIYSHTDGFIVPHWKLSSVCHDLDARGIQYSIKGEGPTEIYNVGAYRIGDKITKINVRRTSTASGINHGLRDWWLNQWDRGLALRR